jgi:hypothetical protein
MPISSAHLPTEKSRPAEPWTLATASQALTDSLIQMPLTRDSSIQFLWSGNHWLLACQRSPDVTDHRASLRGFMGFLPFSAENRNARQEIVETIRTVPHCSRGQLRIDRRGRLFFKDSIMLPDPVTPQSLMTAAVVMLLQASPIVEAVQPFLIRHSAR